MAEEVLTGSLILFDGTDLSCQLNQVALDYSAESLDRTAFCHETRVRVGGLLTAAVSAQGFYDSPDPDAALFPAVSTEGKVISVASKEADGNIAYTLRSMLGEYSPIQGETGELAGFGLSAGLSTGPLVRGTIMHNAERTASGNGVARQLGAVGATQSLYAALHVVSVSGGSPTLDVTVESDDNAGMSTALTQATFSQASAPGAEWQSVGGAIADDWWRINYTIGGSSPSFEFVVILGIQ